MSDVDVLTELREATRGVSVDLLRRARDVARERLWEHLCAEPTGPGAEHAGRLLRAFTVVVGEREAELEAEATALLRGFDPDRWLS